MVVVIIIIILQKKKFNLIKDSQQSFILRIKKAFNLFTSYKNV